MSPRPQESPRPYIFVDRDGTLVEDRGYVHRVEDYHLLDGVVEGLRLLGDGGYRIAIVTNQSGIDRGYFTQAQFEGFQAHLCGDLAQHGVQIDASFFCPHLPDAGCQCRKPATGLLERAVETLGADLARSWMIGDTPADMELAQRAGCKCVYVLSGHGASEKNQLPAEIRIAAGLLEAARLILADDGKRR